jgi:hypothetical protein
MDLASAVEAVLGSLEANSEGTRPARGRWPFSWGLEWGRSHQRNGVKR